MVVQAKSLQVNKLQIYRADSDEVPLIEWYVVCVSRKSLFYV